MSRISKKKQKELYDSVHKEIFDARIKIWRMKGNQSISIAEVDDILSDLCVSAPKTAIKNFTVNQ